MRCMDPDLEVRVEGDTRIIIAKPDTDMWVIYQKDPYSPNLLLTDTWLAPSVTHRLPNFGREPFRPIE